MMASSDHSLNGHHGEVRGCCHPTSKAYKYLVLLVIAMMCFG